MGLFNLSKKRDDSLASQPISSESGPQQTGNPQTSEEKEEINFDELSLEAPMPPLDSPDSQDQETNDSETEPSETEEASNHPEIKPGFELPDFLDEEMKADEETKPVKKEAEKKQEPVKPVSQGLADPEKNKSFLKPVVIPEPVKPKPAPQPIRLEVYPQPVRPRLHLEKLIVPEKPKETEPKEPFMEINRYFELKDDFEDIRKLLSAAQDIIEQDTIMNKNKSDKYQATSESLNYIQEKLMLIDTKLFESE